MVAPPLLSLCIPTLNRAELLEVLLENISIEIEPFLDEVEIVVADNASHDETAEIVRRSGLPIVYGRQPSTVGFAKNILFAICDLATAEFVWLIGDDDLILPGGIRRIIESLRTNSDVDYHYLNFGWVDHQYRTKVVREAGGKPDDRTLQFLQFNDRSSMRLSRIEDIAFLPGNNPSVLFSGIFCFVTRRLFFVEGRETLSPSDSLDGSSVLIDDCFPHAILTVPRAAGKPVAYLGDPCVMQGIGAWEWGRYAHKNMIFGIFQFLTWLESTPFAKDALAHLWHSWSEMTGRLLFRMLYYPDDHQGLEIVLNAAVPHAARMSPFWKSFIDEARLNHETDFEAHALHTQATALVSNNPSARIALWGIAGRGHRFIKFSPNIANRNLVCVVDKETTLSGTHVEYTNLKISSPPALSNFNIDILILGIRRNNIPEVINEAKKYLKPGAIIVSIDGNHVI